MEILAIISVLIIISLLILIFIGFIFLLLQPIIFLIIKFFKKGELSMKPTAEQMNLLEEISKKIGCSVKDLLKDGIDPASIIEAYQQNELKILND